MPRRAFDLALNRGKVLVSSPLLVELDSVLRRPKLDAYAAEPGRLDFLAALVRVCEVVQIVHAVRECRDPRDNHVLELAVSGSATHIVTGDKDLLAMHPFRGVKVLAPQDFVTDMKMDSVR